uniref:Uncharacterized protein n=1 Tax=Parascaris univalens TaxID=6257 RepID=A0A915BLV8_PARUN
MVVDRSDRSLVLFMMISKRSFSYPFLFLTMIICWTTLWILHSSYFLRNYEESAEKTILLRKSSKQLSFPALIICNRMPFSQEGFRRIPSLYQDHVIRYLHEWVDPSLRLAADYTPLSTQQQIHAQQLIAQSLPQSTRTNVLSDAFVQCHNVINSCRFQGRTMTAVECCRSVRTNVPTVNGICWSFKDTTLTINNTALNSDFQITFQIPRDSYYMTTPSTYPRIDVYLVDDIEDQWKLAVGLSNPLKLIDKGGVRFRFRKEVSTDLRRGVCGTTSRSAQRADQIASESNRTKLFPCILMAVIRHCQCHPLYTEFLRIDPSNMRFAYRS